MNQDQNPDARFTTMLDVYRLPADFPGLDGVKTERDPRRRVAVLEEAFAVALADRRFVPYLQLHEFEALVLTEPTKLGLMYPTADAAINNLVALRDKHGSPEMINLDDPPSKRIEALIPDYRKTAAAAQVVQAIGLEAMRHACPHFADWLARLEALAA